jgi:hypothetical protein
MQKAKALVSEVISGSTSLTYNMQKISVKNRTKLQVKIQVQREVISFLRLFMQSADNVVERRRNAYKAAENESSMRGCCYIYTS